MAKFVGKKEKLKGRPDKHSPDKWIAIRTKFVQGVEDLSGNRQYPTLDSLAVEYEIPIATVYNHSASESWLEQRNMFQTKLQNELDESRRKQLVKDASAFDSASLSLARAIQGEIGQIIKTAQDDRRDNTSTKKNPISPSSLNSLSMALSIAQRVGRLALGETTDNTNVNATIDNRTQIDEALSIVRDIARAKSSSIDILH